MNITRKSKIFSSHNRYDEDFKSTQFNQRSIHFLNIKKNENEDSVPLNANKVQSHKKYKDSVTVRLRS